jgi:SsrA-binding protein
MSKSAPGQKTIALNKRASHEYYLEERIEAGLQLQGWEVKAMREGRGQITDTYVVFKGGEAYVLNMHILPLPTISTHVKPEPERSRKLLLHKKEINKLMGAKERGGYTIVATALYWKNNKAKLEIALAKGKKLHDKRDADKEKDWKREQARLVRRKNC